MINESTWKSEKISPCAEWYPLPYVGSGLVPDHKGAGVGSVSYWFTSNFHPTPTPPLRRGGDSEHRLLHISDFLKWAQEYHYLILTTYLKMQNYKKWATNEQKQMILWQVQETFTTQVREDKNEILTLVVFL